MSSLLKESLIQIIKSFIESCGVRLTCLDCKTNDESKDCLLLETDLR